MKKIVVLAKQVPDTENVGDEAMKEDGTVNRGKLPAIFNPEDLNALEIALHIREKLGGSVSVVTMGPPNAKEILKHALYMGADDVYLVSDKKFAASDTLATSYVLSGAVKYLEDVDLVLGGTQAIDGDTAQVGPQTAEKLGYNQITYVEDLIEFDDDSVIVKRDGEKQEEKIKSDYPLLMTVTSDSNDPRYPDCRNMLKYFRSDIEDEISEEEREDAEENDWVIPVLTADDLGLDEDRCGLSGSPTQVSNIENIQLSGGDLEMYDNKDDSIQDLVKDIMKDYVEVE